MTFRIHTRLGKLEQRSQVRKRDTKDRAIVKALATLEPAQVQLLRGMVVDQEAGLDRPLTLAEVEACEAANRLMADLKNE